MLTRPGLDAVRPLLLWASQLNSAGLSSPAGKTHPVPWISQNHPNTTSSPPANTQGFPFSACFHFPL